MSLQRLSANIDKALAAIDGPELERRAAIAGADLVSLITSRVIRKGETSDGGTFTAYSTTPVPAWFYLGKSRTGSAESRVKEASKKREEISYKQFREYNNLKTDKKNFEFTGTMWRGFGVTKIVKQGDRLRIVLNGRNDDSREKIEWLSDQEKQSIIEPSQAELLTVKRNLETWLISILNGRG